MGSDDVAYVHVINALLFTRLQVDILCQDDDYTATEPHSHERDEVCRLRHARTDGADELHVNPCSARALLSEDARDA